MINKIEANLKNGALKKNKIIILPEQKKCYINEKQYEITNTYIDKILNILSTWKYEYGNSNKGIDNQEFTIVVYSDDKETKYHGKGIFPSNYDQFIAIFKEISEY